FEQHSFRAKTAFAHKTSGGPNRAFLLDIESFGRADQRQIKPEQCEETHAKTNASADQNSRQKTAARGCAGRRRGFRQIVIAAFTSLGRGNIYKAAGLAFLIHW